MTAQEYDDIDPMTNEEIDAFKESDIEVKPEDSSVEDLQDRLKKEERRIISLMKRIVYDVTTYQNYDPLEEFINALKNSKYLDNDKFKAYITEEGKKYLSENLAYIDFLKKVEKIFDDEFSEDGI
jgi:cytochrome b involved in lipid metabolism